MNGHNIMMSDGDVNEWHDPLHINRLLQSTGQRGRTVLTALYLCVLGLCFVVPIFYYFRMRCEERRTRRLRETELAGITQALEQSQNVHREESRAARRKFRDERKARINQLFAPVKMELKEENFPHLREGTNNTSQPLEAPNKLERDHDVEDSQPITSETQSISADASTKSIDEDQLFVEVPSPGFQLASASLVVGRFTHRLVPNVCSICLCNYHVGNTVVWSSNEACDHVFHEHCILQWLMKQRDGPLCPCCRRDFVLDPYDMEGLDPVDLEGEEINPNSGISLLIRRDSDRVESTTNNLPSADTVLQEGAQIAMNMEEGLSSNSSNSTRQGLEEA